MKMLATALIGRDVPRLWQAANGFRERAVAGPQHSASLMDEVDFQLTNPTVLENGCPVVRSVSPKLHSLNRIAARPIEYLCKCTSAWHSIIGSVFAQPPLLRTGLDEPLFAGSTCGRKRQVVPTRLRSWSSERSQAVSARLVLPRT
jgi:hypothetical protein